MARMVRTNIVIDQGILKRVMDLYGLKTKREAVDFALRYAARAELRKKKTLALEGVGWEGDTQVMRQGVVERQ